MFQQTKYAVVFSDNPEETCYEHRVFHNTEDMHMFYMSTDFIHRAEISEDRKTINITQLNGYKIVGRIVPVLSHL